MLALNPVPILPDEVWIRIFRYTQHTSVTKALVFTKIWSIVKVAPLVNHTWRLLPTPRLECIQERDRQRKEVNTFIDKLIEQLGPDADLRHKAALENLKEGIFQQLKKVFPEEVNNIISSHCTIEKRILDIEFASVCIRSLRLESLKELIVRINEIKIDPIVSGTPTSKTLENACFPNLLKLRGIELTPLECSGYYDRVLWFKRLCEVGGSELVLAIAQDTSDSNLRNPALAGFHERDPNAVSLSKYPLEFPCKDTTEASKWIKYFKELSNPPPPTSDIHLYETSWRSRSLKGSCLIALCRTMLKLGDCKTAAELALETLTENMILQGSIGALQEVMGDAHKKDEIQEVLAHVLPGCKARGFACLLEALIGIASEAPLLLEDFSPKDLTLHHYSMKIFVALASEDLKDLKEDEMFILRKACTFFSTHFLDETLGNSHRIADSLKRDELLEIVCQSLKDKGRQAIALKEVVPLISRSGIQKRVIKDLEGNQNCIIS